MDVGDVLLVVRLKFFGGVEAFKYPKRQDPAATITKYHSSCWCAQDVCGSSMVDPRDVRI